MMKKALFAVALLSVALWSGCATGGGGHTGGRIQVALSPGGPQFVGVTLTLSLTATVTNTDSTAVTWTLTQSGAACSPGCGTLSTSGNTAIYSAPATPPNPSKVDVTATSVANPQKSDTDELTVLPITVVVTPGPAEIGLDQQQQFTAVVTPDAAPQTVVWSIVDCPSSDCGSIDANGLYTAPGAPTNEASFSIQAVSTIDSPNWASKEKATVVNSRLSGSYAFRVTGFDSTNHAFAAVGNLSANDDGTIQGGATVDMLLAGVPAHCTVLNTSTYVTEANNHATLTLRTSGSGACTNPAVRKFKIVLNSDGDGQMIQFDASGRSSGVLAQTASGTSVLGTFAFGFTGSDLGGHRMGMAGVFQADGAGGIGSTGSLDINDNGAATSSTGFDPDSSGYTISGGKGTLTLVSNGATYSFAVYVVGGKTQNDVNPLTLFAISNDGPTNHAASGTIVFQDPTPIYDKSALDDFSVTNLTGVDNSGTHAQVSLTAARGDKNGNIAAQYDANNAGTIVAAKAFNSTYTATGNGRYTVDWLSPAVHFVLYLTANNRGFMLDQSSTAVFTGTMDPQSGSNFATSEMAGTLDAATGSCAVSACSQVAMNLLSSSTSTTNYKLDGVQDETDGGLNAGQTVTAPTNTMTSDGTGKITLTAPAATNYLVYAIDNPKQGGFLIQHFEMIDVDSSNLNPTIIFGER